MTVTIEHLSEPPVWLGTLFDRVLCGVDGTESSRVAIAQAMRLLPPHRTLQLVAVVEGLSSPWGPSAGTVEFDRRYGEAQDALCDGMSVCPRAHSLTLFGDPGPTLAKEALESGASLVAAGAPASGRLGGIVLGSVGTYLLHGAPCSLLIARATTDDGAFPRSIVVGHDGSRNAAAAAAVAKDLAHRFGASLRTLVATGGDPVEVDRLALESELEWSDLSPAEALIAASEDADLLVVGTRGLRRLRSLGSVSERVGHLARSSVLVVREPARTTGDDDGDADPDLEC